MQITVRHLLLVGISGKDTLLESVKLDVRN